MEQLQEIFSAMMGTGRVSQPDRIIESMKYVDGKTRSQQVLNMLLTAPLGNRMAESILGRVRFLEHDLVNRGQQKVFDWMLNADEARRLHPNIDDLLGLTSYLLPHLSFKGYGDWDGVRSRIGGAVSPAVLAMMEVWGPRKMAVSFHEGGGYVRKDLTLPISKIIGKIAYTQDGIKAFNSRDRMDWGGVMMGILAEATAEAIDKPELASENVVARDEARNKFIAADITTQNGEPVTSWDHLMEVLSSMPFIAENFVNINADQMEMAQHAYGGFANEKARSTWGSLYYIDEGQLNHQLGPEVHLLSAFGGLLSQYATKGGLNWMFKDSAWVGEYSGVSVTAEGEAGDKGLRGKFMREVVSYEPRQGDADLIEANLLQRFIAGENISPEMVQRELGRVPKLGRPHLRPPELWVPAARRMLRENPEYARAWLSADVDMTPWAKKAGVELNNCHGVEGLMEFLEKASKIGVGLYEWDKFNARMVGDEMRYAGKVEVTSEAFRAASQEVSQAGTGIDEGAYRGQHRELVVTMQQASFEAAANAAEVVGKAEKDLLKWMSLDRQESFTASWVKGVIRSNLVPFLDDNSTLLFDFDEKDFRDSTGVVVKPKKFWIKELSGEMVGVRSMDQLETFMKESGMRWSIYRGGDHDGEKFIINTSGRPSFKVSTSRRLFEKAGRELSLLETRTGHVDNEAVARISRMRQFLNAIISNGWNRFSINWWMGYTPGSVESMLLLVDNLQDVGAIGEGDVGSLHHLISSLGHPGDSRLVRLGKGSSVKLPLGSAYDPSVGLPDPRYMRPHEAKPRYQAFSAHNQ
jgi:hypothetical protein